MSALDQTVNKTWERVAAEEGFVFLYQTQRQNLLSIAKARKKNQGSQTKARKQEKPIAFNPDKPIDQKISQHKLVSFYTMNKGEQILNQGRVQKVEDGKIILDCDQSNLETQPVRGNITLKYPPEQIRYEGKSRFISLNKPLPDSLKSGDLAFWIKNGRHYEGIVACKPKDRNYVKMRGVVSELEWIGKYTLYLPKNNNP